ncbi:MAG: hypothetical protein GXO36_01900 [Chloroflexi bacterium]|nr:hypothetical protein [Chloroflexota bacterium]
MPTKKTPFWRIALALIGVVTASLLTWRGLTQPTTTVTPPPILMGAVTPVPASGPVAIYETETWTLYLTQPDHPAARRLRGGPDAYLARAIDQAQHEVNVATYHLDLWSLRDALLRAHERGVRVQIVAERDHVTPELKDLRAAGIPVRLDGDKGLMHHKFVVIDGYDVWTGSMNFTVAGTYHNENNLIRIQSERLAKNYNREFMEMFREGRFGAASRADTPYPRLQINGILIENLFSPDDDVALRLLGLLRQAQSRVLVLAFTWTSDTLTQGLREAHQRGVQVEMGVDENALEARGNDLRALARAGAWIWIDESPGLLHHKVMVIDRRIVVLGSYNFTKNAETRNDENVLIVHDPRLAQVFETWWQTHQPRFRLLEAK